MAKLLSFAQRYVVIKQNELDLIFYTRKSLLYCKDTPSIEKEGNGQFDVIMGSNDGAYTCKIAGLFLLYSIEEKFNKDIIGLYIDDGLTCFRYNNSHQNNKTRKELIKIFPSHGLKEEIKCNLENVDYLEITFDLNTGPYRP